MEYQIVFRQDNGEYLRGKVFTDKQEALDLCNHLNDLAFTAMLPQRYFVKHI